MAWYARATSDVGCIRSQNEDRYYINNRQHLYIVADGMGGVEGGEVAAELITQELPKLLFNDLQKHSSILTEAFQLDLQESIHAVNDLVYRTGQERGFPGMGATLVLALFEKNQAIIAHVGDSRCYLLSEEQLHPLTVDHTCPEATNELTRVIGTDEFMVADICHQTLKPTDRLLLCSDGLNHMVSDDVIHQAFRYKTSEIVGKHLIQSAKQAGGEDNITCVVIQHKSF